MTKIGTLYVFINLLSGFLCHRNLAQAFLLNLLEILLVISLLFSIEARQNRLLKDEVRLFLDCWILNLRLGLALPTARDRALNELSTAFQQLARPLFGITSAGSKPCRHGLFAEFILNEFEKAQVEPHSALTRLENLRSQLSKAAEFRRKSGQAVRQTRIQAVVLQVLLFALTIFTVQRYGWRRCADLIMISQVLSILGMILMNFLARKSKWKT